MILDRDNESGVPHLRPTRDTPVSKNRPLNPKSKIQNPKSKMGWRTHLLVLAGFSLLTFFMTLPLPLELASRVPGGGDAWQHIWNLWWVKDALLHGQNVYHTNLLYYPDGVNLYFHTLVLTAGLIGIPLQLLGLNLIATYNLILLSSFVLAGYGMFLLCHYLTGHKWAAFVGGIIFAFAPYHFAHVYGHMNLISIQWMPFYVLLLLKAIDAPARKFKVQSSKFKVEEADETHLDTGETPESSPKPRNFGPWTLDFGLVTAAGAGALLAVNAYTDWTYAAYLLILTVMVLLWRVLRRSERAMLREKGVGWRQGGLRLLVGFGVFFLLVSPILFPMLAEAQLGYAQQDGHETLVYSSDVVLAFTPSELHPLWGQGIKEYVGNLGPYLPVKNPSERTLFLGYMVLALSIFAFWRLRKVGQVRFWAVAALITWILSLGPLLQLNGETAFTGFKVSYPLPYLLLFDLPFFSIMRSPSRLTVLTMLALAALAAYSVAYLLRRLEQPRVARRLASTDKLLTSPDPRPPTPNSRTRAWRAAGFAFVAIIVPALILFEFLAALDIVPPGWDVPIYSKIAAEPGQFALLELPLRPFGDYMAYQTVHGKPIVGGYLSRQPPYPTRDNTPVLRYLMPATDVADPLRDEVAGGKGVQALRDLQVKYIIIRWWAFNPPEKEAIEAKLSTLLDDRAPDYHYKKDQVDVWQLYP
ncbi:MAG TPA: hypothetical protein VJ183_12620 [Chloroflexia bacterium]|nr:hypothetical protein [Chloroflexia bacterium]